MKVGNKIYSDILKGKRKVSLDELNQVYSRASNVADIAQKERNTGKITFTEYSRKNIDLINIIILKHIFNINSLKHNSLKDISPLRLKL